MPCLNDIVCDEIGEGQLHFVLQNAVDIEVGVIAVDERAQVRVEVGHRKQYLVRRAVIGLYIVRVVCAEYAFDKGLHAVLLAVGGHGAVLVAVEHVVDDERYDFLAELVLRESRVLKHVGFALQVVKRMLEARAECSQSLELGVLVAEVRKCDARLDARRHAHKSVEADQPHEHELYRDGLREVERVVQDRVRRIVLAADLNIRSAEYEAASCAVLTQITDFILKSVLIDEVVRDAERFRVADYRVILFHDTQRCICVAVKERFVARNLLLSDSRRLYGVCLRLESEPRHLHCVVIRRCGSEVLPDTVERREPLHNGFTDSVRVGVQERGCCCIGLIGCHFVCYSFD